MRYVNRYRISYLTLMLRSLCRAIRYEHHDWPLMADRGICLKFQARIRSHGIRYVLIRFSVLVCDSITIYQFQNTRSGLLFRHDHINGSIPSTMVSRSDAIITIEASDSVRSCTGIYTFRTDALCCDRIRL